MASRCWSLAILALLSFASCVQTAADTPSQEVADLPLALTARWPVDADGRLKPLQSYALDSLSMISGRRSILGWQALPFLWACHFDWEQMQDAPVVRVSGLALRQSLGLPEGELRFSYRGLIADEAFRDLVQEGRRRRASGRPVTASQREALAVYKRLERLQELAEGSALRLLPLQGRNATLPLVWVSPSQLQQASREEERQLFASFVQMNQAYRERDAAGLERAIAAIEEQVATMAGADYPNRAAFQRELLLLRWRPASWAAGAYLGAFVLAVLAIRFRGGRLLARLLGAAAILAQTADLSLRWSVVGHIPILTTREAFGFWAWVVVLIAAVVSFRTRHRHAFAASTLLAGMALLFAKDLPVDAAKHPLTSVLNESAWLSLHVGSVMLAFAAFALAMVLAHFSLLRQWRRPQSRVLSLTSLTDRAMGLGILFLCIGIGAGGEWAHRAWGRYWAWNPKETWSLLTLAGYALLLHARHSGWMGACGQAIGAILGFLAVLMTTYGVNVLMASGLHDFGLANGYDITIFLFALSEAGIALVAARTLARARITSLSRPLEGGFRR